MSRRIGRPPVALRFEGNGQALVSLIRTWRNALAGTRTRSSLIQRGVPYRAVKAQLEDEKMKNNASSKRAAPHHVPMFNAVEMTLVAAFVRSTGFAYEILSECENRGYLPLKLVDQLLAAKFLARTVLAAQKAQRSYGVPASVLISIAMQETTFEANRLTEKANGPVEWPGCDCCYSPEIHKWFMEKAAFLAESRRYRKAMKLLPDLDAYVKRIYSLGLGDHLDAQDVLNDIDHHDLRECDLAALRQPGEYNKKEFEAVRGESGAVTFVNPLAKALVAVQGKNLSTPSESQFYREV